MPLSGGATDKFGNKYENIWTVRCIISLMNEFCDSIYLEPPGDDGIGMEFYIEKNGNKEYHQVKSQNSKSGNFTNARLNQMEVLGNFWRKLKSDDESKCVFVSMDAAHQLRKLSTRANESMDSQTFKQYFVTDQDSQEWLGKLRSYWENCTEEMAYKALKRIEVRTQDIISLKEETKNILVSIVVGNYDLLIDCLGGFISENVHKSITSNDVWNHLYENGYERRELYKDTRMLTKLERLNSKYLNSIEKYFILDEQINRLEVNEILQLLKLDDPPKTIVVTGEAGAGKSSVLYQAMKSLKKQEWTVLGLRIDRCNPVSLPEKLGDEIGLTNESPATILASIANRKKCLLIIDQLDAVSEVSGRNPQFYDECIENIVEQTKSYPNMHVLISCRKFDIENDYRFKKLLNKDRKNLVMIQPLSQEIISDILMKIDVNVELFSPNQIKLLSNPQLLSIFSGIKDKLGQNFKFETSIDLYDEFWKEKKKSSKARCLHRLDCEGMLKKIVNYMSNEQVLYIPENRLIEYEEEASIMTSENVLVYENRKYFLFHEGFFDYAFARIFTSEQNDLTEFLLNDKQYLFRRSQVRQVLLYERETEFVKYVRDLKNLIGNQEIRYHIKQVVFSILGVLDNPRIEEWKVIQQYIGKDSNYYKEVWKLISYSPGWFKVLDDQGIIQEWLGSNDEEFLYRLIIFFSNVCNTHSDRIVELLNKYINKSEDWNQRLITLFECSDVSCGRKYFEMYLKLIDLGIMDSFGYSLKRIREDWSCEAIQQYLNRELEISINSQETNPFSQIKVSNNTHGNIIIEVAEKAPEKFIELIFPIMFRIIELNLNKEYGIPYKDNIWTFRYKDTHNEIKDSLLKGMEIAFYLMAQNNTSYYETICKEISGYEYETIQHLLLKGYTANAQYFADQAIEYIVNKPYRLETGYSDSRYWITIDLLKEATKYCSNSNLCKIEKAIMNYYPEWEISIDSYKYKSFEIGSPRGEAQFQLLSSIYTNRLTKASHKRLLELERKFSSNYLERVKSRAITDHFAQSPINQINASKMTDKQWIKAVNKYKDSTSKKYIDGIPRGSVRQLSFVLDTECKKNPERFVELLSKFDNDVNIFYPSAILRGLRGEKVNPKKETIMKAILRCHDFPKRPCGRDISWLLRSHAKYKYSKEIFDILIYYAVEDLDPKEDRWNVTVAGDEHYDSGDLFTSGINSVRGSAAEAIALLIHYHEECLDYFGDTLIKMVNDKSIAVRSCVAEILLYLLRYNRNLAVDLFLELCKVEGDELLGTLYIEKFISYGIKTHYNELHPILNRMIYSCDEKIQAAGARQACLALLSNCDSKRIADRCIKGSKAQQSGVAEVFSRNIGNKYLKETCEKHLLKVLESDYEEVRKKAADCFRNIEGDDLNEYWNFVLKYMKTKAFKENSRFLFYALKEIDDVQNEIVFQICNAFVKLVEKETTFYSIRYYNVDVLSKLIMKIYRQTLDEKIKAKSLDIIDDMMKRGAYGINKMISDIER
ncbi:NACHT domain-containing protein [Wukongibacter baidiensis]